MGLSPPQDEASCSPIARLSTTYYLVPTQALESQGERGTYRKKYKYVDMILSPHKIQIKNCQKPKQAKTKHKTHTKTLPTLPYP